MRGRTRASVAAPQSTPRRGRRIAGRRCRRGATAVAASPERPEPPGRRPPRLHVPSRARGRVRSKTVSPRAGEPGMESHPGGGSRSARARSSPRRGVTETAARRQTPAPEDVLRRTLRCVRLLAPRDGGLRTPFGSAVIEFMSADAAGPRLGRLRCLVDVAVGASWAEGAPRQLQTACHAAFPGLAATGNPRASTFPRQGGSCT